MAEFQDLKYNDVEKYEKLVDKTFIQNKFNAGEWLDKVNPEKQARHIQSTVEKGKSYFFDDVDVEALYDKYKMTGTIRKLRSGAKSSDEKIDLFEDRPVGKLTVNPEKHIVTANGKNVLLTYKEYHLLLLLMQNKGVVFSREKLLNKIWGYDFDGENRTVDVHIRTLRTKLGECGNMIETIRGFGYKIGE